MNSEESVNSKQSSVISKNDDSKNELEELKQVNEKQAEEIEGLKKEVEELKTPTSLRNDPKLEASATLVSHKTRGIKPSRLSTASVLQSAAKKAAASNNRSDVHEYMRIRRNFV